MGNFYTLGNMGPYISSYIRVNVDPSCNHEKLIWITAASKLGQGTSMFLGGYLCRRFGSRIAAVTGGLLYCGFVALTTITVNKGFMYVVLSYGFLAYLGVGIAYVTPVHEVLRWFPKKKGLAIGIVLSGYGLSAMVFSPLQTYILNPSNIPPVAKGPMKGYFIDEDLLERVGHIFWKLSIIYLTIAAVGIALMFPAPSPDRQEVVSESREKIDPPDDQPLADMTFRESLRRKEFYMIWVTFALSAVVVEFVNTYYKSYGLSFILNDHYLSVVGALASLCNCLGRIAWGSVMDKTNYKFSMLAILISLSLLTQSFLGAKYIPNPGSTGSLAFYTIWVLLIFFSLSGVFSVLPTATATAFGSSNASLIYGVLYSSCAIGSVLGAFLIQYVMYALTIEWTFTVVAAVGLLGVGITCFMPWNLESIRTRGSTTEAINLEPS